MKKITNRDSNLELLRIIAMITILCQHYVVHGGYDSAIFNNVSINVIYLKILTMFAYAGCTIFALISGYYFININTNDRYYRRIIPLIFETLFYSLLVLLIVMLFKIVPLGIKDILKSLLPMFYGNWYVVFYILIFFFIPFINPFLRNLKKDEFKKLLATIFFFFILIQTFLGNVYDLNNLDFMFIAYFFGAYYRLYQDDYQDNQEYLLRTIFSFIFIILSVLIFDYLGLYLGNDKLIKYDYYFMAWYTIPSFVFALSIFMYMSNKKFHSRIINLIASTTLGVYLLHDSHLKTLIWQMISPNANYVNNPYLHSIIKILLVYIICVIIDLIRQKTIGKWFDTFLSNYFNKSLKQK